MNSHLNQEAMPTIHRHFDLFVDDDQVAMTKIERTLGFRICLDETFDIDSDAGEPDQRRRPRSLRFRREAEQGGGETGLDTVGTNPILTQPQVSFRIPG
tara:strand:- start:39650 stop:39946 length:297 start_codon:yes stop_codon:yes gene_type:complete